MIDNYTHISILLDRSGSMLGVDGKKAKAAINGFNSILEEQKTVPGKATITTVMFNSEYTPLIGFDDISTARSMTPEDFRPEGNTALVDSMCKLMIETGRRLDAMPESDRPSNVIFVVITDGEENVSHEFTREDLSKMVDEQSTKYNWKFLYLGARLEDFDKSGMYGFAGMAGQSVAGSYHGFSGYSGTNIYTQTYNTSTVNGQTTAAEAVNSVLTSVRSGGELAVKP